MPYSVPPLPYDYGALEPHVGAKTMEFHHDKHHQAYINHPNAALKAPGRAAKPPEELMRPERVSAHKRRRGNDGGGHTDHTLFWQILGPAAAAHRPVNWPCDQRELGSFNAFKEKLKAGVCHVLAAWAWPGRQGCRRTRSRFDRGSGQPLDRRHGAPVRCRRLGTCLLPRLPEPPSRLHQRLVEHDQLGRGRAALRAPDSLRCRSARGQARTVRA